MHYKENKVTEAKHIAHGASMPSGQSNEQQQEAFEKCWAHSPLRAASRPFSRCR